MVRFARRIVLRDFALAATALLLATAASAQVQSLPARLTDQQFWKLVTESSEADGFFQSDNLVSNEVTIQYIIPELLKARESGGAYLGVGPDQNFTYIASLRPRIAFIIDIRRQAMMQHLMYKALFELAEDRATFFSLLFSRPRPSSLSTVSTPLQMLEAFYPVGADSTMYWKTRQAIEDLLVRHHGFTLSRDDIAGIDYIFTSFHLAGPDISYNYSGTDFRPRRSGMPSFGELIAATDAAGISRGFLADESRYTAIRQMHLRNLIVPVVGDFAGPKAVRAVGDYLREHGVVVSAIYTSNVEQYLFRQPHAWRQYYENVSTLPADSATVFVRAVFNFGSMGGGGGGGARSITMLQPVHELLKALREGKIQGYLDVVNTSRTVW